MKIVFIIEIRTSFAIISFVYKLWLKYLYKNKTFGCNYHLKVISFPGVNRKGHS